MSRFGICMSKTCHRECNSEERHWEHDRRVHWVERGKQKAHRGHQQAILDKTVLHECDDSKVKYYTRLPSFVWLIALFTIVSTLVMDSSTTSLPPFQQFIVVLMTLRLNLGAQDIAYRLGISQSTVSRYYNKWINVMYVRLQSLVKWLRHDELRKSLLMDFKDDCQNCTTRGCYVHISRMGIAGVRHSSNK